MELSLRSISSLSAGWRRVVITGRRSALAVLKFFVPGHLDGFELGFVGGGGITGEAGEFGDPFVHVREADGEGIDVREFVGQADSDVFEIIPTECWRHVRSRGKLNTETAEGTEKTRGLSEPVG